MEINKNRRRIVVIAIILMLSIGNYFRMFGNEPIRTVHFLQIFVIGALSSLLVYKVFRRFKK